LWVRPDLFLIEGVEFVGVEHADAASLRHLSDVTNGVDVWRLDLNKLERDVERHPWVASASVSVHPVRRVVRVMVSEHEPYALVRAGGLMYVDRQGHPFARVNGDDLNYPLLSGIDDVAMQQHPSLPRLVFEQELALLRELEERAWLSLDDVSEVAFNTSRGLTVHFTSGARVLLHPDRVKQQLERLERLTAEGVDLSTPVLVDLAPRSVAIVRPLDGERPG